ncbi:hypothetical protein AB0A66_05520 [Streptomyces longwoodensis]|uniref:hypothetical protein n=1 Tax=Streptomyces longwoodensis TaxID=68231 RepID=UPI0033DBAB3B
MAAGRWVTGLAATGVLVATGAWVRWPAAGVDGPLWEEVRPVIEARLAAQAQGTGYGSARSGPGARWFCRARALDLDERDGLVRAGVATLCVEYGARGGALVECGGAVVPQEVRLRRGPDGGYRIVSRDRAPDGAGAAAWRRDHFGPLTDPDRPDPAARAALETAARSHFGLPADAPVRGC